MKRVGSVSAPLELFYSGQTSMATITSIERTWVELPLKEVPWRNMVREIAHWRLFEVCRVELDRGPVGVGETMPYYPWGGGDRRGGGEGRGGRSGNDHVG